MQDQLTALKQKIEQTRATELVKFKDEIKRAIEIQIAFHYRLRAGQAELSADSDLEIQAAKKSLSELSLYKKMLSPQ